MSTHEICFRSAIDLAASLRRGDLSCVEVMDAHLAQIARVNPRVNAIVTLVAEQARAAAATADTALARGDDVGPLHGLPVAHKDLVLTRNIRTTFGSRVLEHFVPDQDALLVERLHAAGAITVGKTNTPEFGAGSQTFNAVFGATRNPYDLSTTCGGSSGGAAVALACGMVPLADGSDLGGSLRNPASFCNVVGLRPAAGRVPSWPTDAAWYPLAVEGPMARTVADAALLLSVLAGPDPRAPISITEDGARFRQPLERDFRGVRVAWSRDLGGLPVDPRVTAVVDAARPVFADLGCIVDDAEPNLRGADDVFNVMRAWRMALTLGPLLDTHREVLKDTVIWNIERGLELSGMQVAVAERERTAIYHRVREFLTAYEFLVLPVSQVPPFPVEEPYPRHINGEAMLTYIDWMRSCSWITVTGLPAISVPGGFTPEGLPIGVQIVGRHQDEWGVLQLAHAFEQATKWGEKRPAVAR